MRKAQSIGTSCSIGFFESVSAAGPQYWASGERLKPQEGGGLEELAGVVDAAAKDGFAFRG